MAGALTCLGVPIDSVGAEGGTERGPAALRRRLGGLPMVEAGDTHRQLRGGVRDPETGWLDFADVLAMTAEVRRRVAAAAGDGRPLLVLGGCCTLVPAVVAGVRDASGGEPIGLAYLDGHMDLYEGATSPTGEGADMPVATMLGRAPAALLGELAPRRLVDPDRICLIGARDREERADLGDPSAAGTWGIEWFRDRDSLRGADLGVVGAQAAAHLSAKGRFWLALDVDVLDEAEFPATDYLMPDGLSLADLEALMRPLATSPALAGVSVTCFNPEKDPDGHCGAALADLLTNLLA